mgnify:FL=1
MIHGCLTRTSDGRVIENVSKTNNFIERMRGLLWSSPLKNSEGLLILPCSSVHTFGMGYSIDLVFLDKQWTILKMVKSLKPWRMSISGRSNMVLELAANSIERFQLAIGQQLEWKNDPQE